MISPDLRTTPKRMLAAYNSLTGYNLEFCVQRDWALSLFCLKFNEDDLRTLIHHIKSKGKKGRSLLFRNLIAGPESILAAEEELAEARVQRRRYVETPRDKALRSHGLPTGEPKVEAKSVSAFIPQTPEEIKAMWAQWRKESGI